MKGVASGAALSPLEAEMPAKQPVKTYAKTAANF